MRAFTDGVPGAVSVKGLHCRGASGAALHRAAEPSPQGQTQLETDRWAHSNPTRMASIRRLSFRLVRRMATAGTSCQAPGCGVVARASGLPCGGRPTALIRIEIHGCLCCEHRRELPRRDGLRQADPGPCPFSHP